MIDKFLDIGENQASEETAPKIFSSPQPGKWGHRYHLWGYFSP